MKTDIETKYKIIEDNLNKGVVMPVKDIIHMRYDSLIIKPRLLISIFGAVVSALIFNRILNVSIPLIETIAALILLNLLIIYSVNNHHLKNLKLTKISSTTLLEEFNKKCNTGVINSTDYEKVLNTLNKLIETRFLLAYEHDWFVMKLIQMNNIQQDKLNMNEEGNVNMLQSLTLTQKAQYAAMWAYKEGVVNGTEVVNPFTNNLQQDFEDGLTLAKNSNINLINDLHIDIDKLKKYD